MKKRMIAALAMATMLVGSFPMAAMAAGNLTDSIQAGDTKVEARILGGGEVSYTIAIPEKIDFGTLQMPTDSNTVHEKKVGFTVKAVKIEGLDTTKNRVVVLAKDETAGTEENENSDVFMIKGMSDTNQGKKLKYNVLGGDTNKTDITTGTLYDNGYLLCAFSAAEEKVDGTLVLEQNQLREDPILANWAGDYQGKINFYTAIASVGDFNSSKTE